MTVATRARLAPWLACAAVPAGILAAMLAAYRGVAPLWAGGSTDPSYAYLLNSLMAAELRVPAKTDHPGIPLTLLGAFALRVWHLLSGSALPLRDHVLADPEPFLAAIVVLLLTLWAAAAAFLGWAAWRLTGEWWVATVAQASPFICLAVFQSGVQVMCEPLLLAAALTLSGLILLTLRPGSGSRTARIPTAMGLVLALGLATKLVFLPAVIPALAVVPNRKGRWRMLAVAAVAFGACLILIGPRLPATAAWLWRLFAHSGYHGTGAATVTDPSRYISGWASLLRAEPPLHAAFVASLIACLWPPGSQAVPRAARHCAFGLFAAWTLTMVLAAKQPLPHYLVTTAGLLPALLVLALWHVTPTARSYIRPLGRTILFAILAIGAVHTSRGALAMMTLRHRVKDGARLVAEAASHYGQRPLYGHRASTIPGALAAGDEWTNLAFSRDLRRLYPDVLSFDCEGLHAFGESVTARDVLGHLGPDGTAVVQAATWRPLQDCGWTAALPRRLVASAGRDALYETRLLPPRPGADTGPWLGGLLVATGIDGAIGPSRWATGPLRALAFLRARGTVMVEIVAGHGLPGDQGLSVVANGIRVHHQALPRLPSTARFDVPIDGVAGWNQVEVLFDATAPAGPWTESPMLGYRTRNRGDVRPGVRFDRFRLVTSGQ